MAHEGPLAGKAGNGPHGLHLYTSKRKVDAAHQRAETPVILDSLEQMNNNSGLHNPPALQGIALVGQIHNWQMYSSTPS